MHSIYVHALYKKIDISAIMGLLNSSPSMSEVSPSGAGGVLRAGPLPGRQGRQVGREGQGQGPMAVMTHGWG